MGNYYAGMMNNTGGYGELKHHGILGQKWGVRRFQNADGSLTAAGKERYGYFGEDRKSIVDLAKRGDNGRKLLCSHPRIREASKAIDPERQNFKALREKRYSVLKNIPEKLMYDDKWLRSNDPRAIEYKKVNSEYNKAFNKYEKSALKQASKLVGVDGLELVNKNGGNTWNSFNVKEQVAYAIMYQELFAPSNKDDVKEQSKSITKWFGSHRLSDLKNDMQKNGASNFDEYLQSISDNPDAVRADLDKRANEVKDSISKSYYKLAKAAEETPERYISTESLEGRLASKSDDYKYVRNCVSNAYDITDYRKIYSEYESARARRANSAFGGFENSKYTKNLRVSDNKLKRASKDLEGLSLSAAFDYIEKLPKSDQNAYKAYLYCLMGYDW